MGTDKEALLAEIDAIFMRSRLDPEDFPDYLQKYHPNVFQDMLREKFRELVIASFNSENEKKGTLERAREGKDGIEIYRKDTGATVSKTLLAVSEEEVQKLLKRR